MNLNEMIENFMVISIAISKENSNHIVLTSRSQGSLTLDNIQQKHISLIHSYIDNSNFKEAFILLKKTYPEANNFFIKQAEKNLEIREILTLDKNGNNALMNAKDLNELKTILKKAKNVKCLSILLSLQNKNKKSAFSYFLAQKKIKFAHAIALLIKGKYQIRRACHYVRIYMINYEEGRSECNKIIDIFRRKLNYTYFDTFKNPSPTKSIVDAYNERFKTNKVLETMNDDEKMLGDVASLLGSPEDCAPYLQTLEKNFTEYYEKKHSEAFPKLPDSEYHFAKLNDLEYPIPNEDYIGISKKHALTEYLVEFFKEHGLANNIYKWLGFIPAEQADKMFAEGDFITESRTGTGLFHGKLSHMIQMYILILAIQAKKITCKISIKEFIKKLSTLKINGKLVRIPLVDTRIQDSFTFFDPYKLIESLMRFGKEIKIPNISAHLIDSHCKGFIKLTKIFNHAHNMKLNHNELADYLSDIQLHLFNSTVDLAYIKIDDKSLLTNTKRKELVKKGDRYSIFKPIDTEKRKIKNNDSFVSDTNEQASKKIKVNHTIN